MVTSPNTRFARIEDIKRAQISVRERPDSSVDSDDTDSLASTLSCITVEE